MKQNDYIFCFCTISNPARRSVWGRATKRVRCTFFLAAFPMATSAIGPGFLPQTAVFTGQLLPFAVFAIAMSLVASSVVRLNIGRIICVFNLRTLNSFERVVPGPGQLPAFAVAQGGLAFDVGNVGGAALGVNTMLGLHQ